MNHWYIFDCYGTLVHPISNSWAKEFLQTIKPEERTERIHRIMTTPTSIQDHLTSDSFRHIDNITKSQIIDFLQADTTTLYNDAQRILEHCIGQNIPFCILSNLSADYKQNIEELIIEPYIHYHDILFKVLFSCDIGYKKPEPASYELAINFLQSKGIHKDKMAMIWDNPKYDYLTPLSLWLQAKRIQRNKKQTDINPQDIIHSFDELIS